MVLYQRYLVLLEPTSPLTTGKDIKIALEDLQKYCHLAESIVGVSKVEQSHPDFNVLINKEGFCVPYLKKQKKHLRRQDIDDVFFHDGSLYISKVDAYMKNKTFYHNKTLPYITPKWKSFEIDDFIDFIFIEAILNNMEKLNQ